MAPGQIPHPTLPIIYPVQDPHPFSPANRQPIMGPGQIPHPYSQANRQPIMAPGQIRHPHWPPNYYRGPPGPGPFGPRLPYGFYENWHRNIWIIRIQDIFQQVIRDAERQPSNGTTRKVERPDDETRFMVAYSFAPDQELHDLFEKIWNKHGEVTLQHDGRDSTGKHWIECLSKPRSNTNERATVKAVICVVSKFQLATVTSLRMREAAKKKMAKAAREKKEGPPKVPEAVARAPEKEVLLPWKKKVPFMNPAAAKAYRERMEREEMEREALRREELTWLRMVKAEAEAKKGLSG